MAPDILRRLEAQYTGSSLDIARALVEAIESGDRVRRAVVFLSGGDLDRLRRNVASAAEDFRDVLWWAEYDPSSPEVQVRSMHDPFLDE